MRERRAVRLRADGTLNVPEDLRQKHDLEEGGTVIVELRDGGLFLRPVSSVSRHTYSDRRRAEFMLSNASNQDDYRRAAEEVLSMGIDPEQVPHRRPVLA